MLASIFSLNVIQTALELGCIYALVALALFLSYSILNIADLSTDGCFTLGCAVACQVALTGHPFLALLAAMAAGVCSGFVTAFLQTRLGVESIMAGIIVNTGLYSVNIAVMGGSSLLNMNKTETVFTKARALLQGTVLSEQYKLLVAVITVIALVAFLALFLRTRLGLAIRATGDNPQMIRAQGINTDLSKVIGLSLSNGLVALSGALLCQYQGYADINMGRGAVVIGLAAVVIGEAVVKHISPNFAVRLTGVLVGAVIYYLVYQVIIFVGFDTDLLKMFSALVVAAFLGVPYVKKQLARKHHVKGGIRHA